MQIRVLAACLAASVVAVGPPAVLCGEDPDQAPAPSVFQQIPMPTLGGTQFWADELFFHRWRIQRNAVTGHCRLLDGNNLRHAWGTFDACRTALDEIKRKQRLPPMHGTGVILLHGLGDTRHSMALLAKYIEKHSDYRVFNVAYPSTRRPIEDHARSLARIVENLDGIERIHFVGHSMGAIVVRRYLADQTDEATGRRPDPRFGRMVMLAPPNHGSIAAARLGQSRAFRMIIGEPGQQLGREWVWLESSLATPRFAFGIIAGGLQNNHGINPLLPGDDDGVVTVQSTRLAGARDFLIVPLLHALVPGDDKVQEYTLRFLQHGYFLSANRRRPVGKDE